MDIKRNIAVLWGMVQMVIVYKSFDRYQVWAFRDLTRIFWKISIYLFVLHVFMNHGMNKLHIKTFTF